MIYSLPKSNWGDCSQCDAKDTACVKKGKELICLFCNSRNKAAAQIEKANKRNALRNVGAKLKSLPQNKELVAQHKSKSELLKIADSLFSKFIINRDKDANGNVQCPCCFKVFSVEQTDNVFYNKEDGFDRINNDKGNKIIQALHFIDRGVYNLRFDEVNVHAGCCYCNLDMHLHKNGFAYRNYYQFMIDNYGEEAVAEMTIEHRKINKLELTQLKNIIEHYREH